ncbi:MAG: hypothetical protein IT284_00705 [Bacteroidetes bacterium]|nr:hypothetical protein [Bacteroidota bacterium]
MTRTLHILIFLTIFFVQGLAQGTIDFQAKAVRTYHRLRHPWNNDVIKKYVPALNTLTSVDEDGVTRPLQFSEQRAFLYALSGAENEGQVCGQGQDGECGPLQITPGLLKIYLDDNPKVARYNVEDLGLEENTTKSLEILNWYILKHNLDTPEKLVRAWNGGSNGYKTDLKFDNEEERERQERRLASTQKHWVKVLVTYQFIKNIEEEGLAPILGSINEL